MSRRPLAAWPKLAFDGGKGLLLTVETQDAFMSQTSVGGYHPAKGASRGWGRDLYVASSIGALPPRLGSAIDTHRIYRLIRGRHEAERLAIGNTHVSSSVEDVERYYQLQAETARRWRGTHSPEEAYEPGDIAIFPGGWDATCRFGILQAGEKPDWMDESPEATDPRVSWPWLRMHI
jgi:hypothetical protein